MPVAELLPVVVEDGNGLRSVAVAVDVHHGILEKLPLEDGLREPLLFFFLRWLRGSIMNTERKKSDVY